MADTLQDRLPAGLSVRNVTWFRVGGVAAIGGGALRIVNAFTIGLASPKTLGILYLITDVLLLLGVIAWYISRRRRLGRSGSFGLMVCVIGILVIRTAALFGGPGYQAGAIALLVGLLVMNMPTLIHRDGSIVPPILWTLSLVCGLGAAAFPRLTILAGVLFGLGFIAAGINLCLQGPSRGAARE